MDQLCVLYLQPASTIVISVINRLFFVVAVILAIFTAWRVVQIGPESGSDGRPIVVIHIAVEDVSMLHVDRLNIEDDNAKIEYRYPSLNR